MEFEEGTGEKSHSACSKGQNPVAEGFFRCFDQLDSEYRQA